MANYFENLDPDTAMELELLSQLIYELRENRNSVLKFHGAQDEAALLQQIETGVVDEHPAYEHYLAARILTDTRETARSVLAERLKQVNRA
jgi:hypothetical protein